MTQIDIEQYLSFVKNTKLPFYEKHAKLNRRIYLILQVLIVVFAALTPIFAVSMLKDSNFGKIATVISSTILAILEGASRLFRFKNIWVRYRNAFNSVNNEVRKFENQIDEYRGDQNRDKEFIIKIEKIIKEEQDGWLKSISNDL